MIYIIFFEDRRLRVYWSVSNCVSLFLNFQSPENVCMGGGGGVHMCAHTHVCTSCPKPLTLPVTHLTRPSVARSFMN